MERIHERKYISKDGKIYTICVGDRFEANRYSNDGQFHKSSWKVAEITGREGNESSELGIPHEIIMCKLLSGSYVGANGEVSPHTVGSKVGCSHGSVALLIQETREKLPVPSIN